LKKVQNNNEVQETLQLINEKIRTVYNMTHGAKSDKGTSGVDRLKQIETSCKDWIC